MFIDDVMLVYVIDIICYYYYCYRNNFTAKKPGDLLFQCDFSCLCKFFEFVIQAKNFKHSLPHEKSGPLSSVPLPLCVPP